MENLLDLPIVFTNHAWERIKECQLTGRKVVWMMHNGTFENEPNVARYKAIKYGEANDEKVKYIRYETYIFTIIRTIDKFRPDREIALLLSVADQRITNGVPVV